MVRKLLWVAAGLIAAGQFRELSVRRALHQKSGLMQKSHS